MMDIEKLTPAPWVVCRETDEFGTIGMPVVRMDGDDSLVVGHGSDWGQNDILNDAEFIAMARNAFDVMMRRGWMPERFSLLGGEFGWRIPMSQANDMIRQHGANAAEFKRFASLNKWPDPFTALVEADKWYRENVEKITQSIPRVVFP